MAPSPSTPPCPFAKIDAQTPRPHQRQVRRIAYMQTAYRLERTAQSQPPPSPCSGEPNHKLLCTQDLHPHFTPATLTNLRQLITSIPYWVIETIHYAELAHKRDGGGEHRRGIQQRLHSLPQWRESARASRDGLLTPQTDEAEAEALRLGIACQEYYWRVEAEFLRPLVGMGDEKVRGWIEREGERQEEEGRVEREGREIERRRAEPRQLMTKGKRVEEAEAAAERARAEGCVSSRTRSRAKGGMVEESK